MAKEIQFDGEILQSPEYPGASYFIVPFDVEKIFGKKRVKIKAIFDDRVEYQGSLVRMGSPDHMLLLRKDLRTKLGKTFGDSVKVLIKEDTAPRKVKIPKDFLDILKENPKIHDFFNQLSYTHQKEYVQWIEEAKKVETRQRRMLKAIEMMQQGKKGH